jgi:hypothetical protein
MLTMVNRLADRRFCEEKGDGFSGGGAQPTQALSAGRNSCLVLRNATHRPASTGFGLGPPHAVGYCRARSLLRHLK